MSAPCQLSQSRLGLLCSAAVVLGADLILICWRFADGQPVWVPALGGCAMLCVSALPADLPSIVKPSQPVSMCVIETSRSVPGEPPTLLYRPPIA